jgi:glycosyltransferase involved in cell wall biosynthesis
LSKIRILHIQLLPLLSGVQNMMLNLLDGLDKEKFDIYVACRPGGDLVPELIRRNYKHIPLHFIEHHITFKDIFGFIELYRICKKLKFDIVHTHSSKTGFLGRIAARLAGVPKIIHTAHGYSFNDFQPKPLKLFYLALEILASRFCDIIAFVNESDRIYAEKNFLFKGVKLLTIFNGVVIPELNQEVEKFDFLKDRFVVGSSSRFSKQKNIVQTMESAIIACRRNPKLAFVFIGDGEYYELCLKMVKSTNLTDSIFLPGWQNNMHAWLEQFDCFMLYSLWEGLPLSILEAMSFGLPIIGSDIKGNNELISDLNGILVEPGKPETLAEVLQSLPERPSEIRIWGENSRKTVIQRFNMEEFIRKYRELYES